MAAVALSFLINIYFHVEDKNTGHRRQIREEFIATTLANMNVGTGALGHMYVSSVANFYIAGSAWELAFAG